MACKCWQTQTSKVQGCNLSRFLQHNFHFCQLPFSGKELFGRQLFFRSEILFTACFLQHRLFIAINTTHLATFSSFRTLFTLSHEMVPKTARSGQKGQFLAFDQGFSWKHTCLTTVLTPRPKTESHRSISHPRHQYGSTRTLLIDLWLVQNSNMHNGMMQCWARL